MGKLIIVKIYAVLFYCVLSTSVYAESAIYTQYISEIFASFAKQAKQEFGIICNGDAGQMPYDVEYIGMRFKANRRATVEEARALEVLVTERFVQIVNDHEKIRPYLREYPFPPNRTEISIAFHSNDERFSDGTIARVSHIGDRLIYRVEDSYADDDQILYEELYTEAAERVKALGITKPLEHETTPFEIALDDVFNAFKKAMRKKYKSECFGIGCKRTDTLEEAHAMFVIYQHADQDQARQIQTYAAETLLDLINSNQKLRPFLKEHPFPLNALKICLEFRKKKFWIGSTAYFDGSIRYVRLENGELTFETSETEQKESYHAALMCSDSIR